MSSMLLAAAAAAALPQAGITAEEALERSREVFGPVIEMRERRPCPQSKPGEIVVCRQFEDPEKLRIPHEVDPDGDVIRAPDVSGLPPCNGGCIKFGSVPDYPPIIDLKAIPEAPEGSDADRLYGWPEGEEPPADP